MRTAFINKLDRKARPLHRRQLTIDILLGVR
jgi:hypothetical protein